MGIMLNKFPLLLVVLDGWGIAPAWGGNAITLAKTPVMDSLLKSMPHTELLACGEAVGLPKGVMGGSEVGHLNIGAGKVVKQYLPLIDEQIKSKKFFTNPILHDSITGAIKSKKSIHLMGIISDGGVHGHINHLFALLEMVKKLNAPEVYMHLFTDGRDSSPTSALVYIDKLLTYLKSSNSNAKIATIVGRFYAMDRDTRWERTKLAYDAVVYGRGDSVKEAREIITKSYAKGIYDEFIQPGIVEGVAGKIKDGDLLISYNFREDRMRQLIRSLCGRDNNAFNHGSHPPKPLLVTFTEYQAGLSAEVVFHKEAVEKSLASVFADSEMAQFHIAETEKYAHVTYFFNGGREDPEPLETRLMIPSPHVATYNLKPEMSARVIEKAVVEKLKVNKTNFYIINFANADMVGHTGDLKATIEAVEVVDECLGELWKVVKEFNGTMVVTADHGNAEQMLDLVTNVPYTEHTLNPVPFIIASNDEKVKEIKLQRGGYLGNIAPTVLELLEIAKPSEMTLESLIER